MLNAVAMPAVDVEIGACTRVERSTRIGRIRQPQRLRDHMDVEGHSVTRVFVSALAGTGLPELRALLSDAASYTAGAILDITGGR